MEMGFITQCLITHGNGFDHFVFHRSVFTMISCAAPSLWAQPKNSAERWRSCLAQVFCAKLLPWATSCSSAKRFSPVGESMGTGGNQLVNGG